jgi:DNA-binding NarL/FixJ family response regulator
MDADLRPRMDIVRTRVVIISGHSLFAEGVASRLSKYDDRLDLEIVDIEEDDFLSKVVSLKPATIILDTLSEEDQEKIRISKLVKALPELTVIQLDPQQSKVQVLTSKGHILAEIKDLIEVIQKNS